MNTNLSCRNDFNLIAIPSPALARRLANLAETGASSLQTSFSRRIEEKRERTRREDDDLFMEFWELTMAVYRETQARLQEQFAIDEEASRLAKERIDQRLAELAQERQDMIDRAVKLEDGRAVFLSEDGTSVYTEDNERLPDEEAGKLLAERRDELEAGATAEEWNRKREERAELTAQRDALIEWDGRREEWKAKVESGALTQDELEDLERAYEDQVPAAVKALRAEAEERRVSAPAANDGLRAGGGEDVAIDLSNVPTQQAGVVKAAPALPGFGR